jgi:hypothetical protein
MTSTPILWGVRAYFDKKAKFPINLMGKSGFRSKSEENAEFRFEAGERGKQAEKSMNWWRAKRPGGALSGTLCKNFSLTFPSASLLFDFESHGKTSKSSEVTSG